MWNPLFFWQEWTFPIEIASPDSFFRLIQVDFPSEDS